MLAFCYDRLQVGSFSVSVTLLLLFYRAVGPNWWGYGSNQQGYEGCREKSGRHGKMLWSLCTTVEKVRIFNFYDLYKKWIIFLYVAIVWIDPFVRIGSFVRAILSPLTFMKSGVIGFHERIALKCLSLSVQLCTKYHGCKAAIYVLLAASSLLL